MIKNNKAERHAKKKFRIRKKISGTAQRPRMTVYRSLHHLYVQLIDDVSNTTVVAASTLSRSLRDGFKEIKEDTKKAKMLGMEIAKLAKEKNITSAVFDRNGYLYHGRVKAIADGAREGGLNL